MAGRMAKQYNHVIFICGRYEGVDARLKQAVKALGARLQEISIGPYVLSGGELPTLVMLEAISRHLPEFLGKAESLEEKRLGVGVPMYTRPEVYKSLRVPKVLLSGDHKKIEAWRRKHIQKR
jgi:tRNA (guanine37-N1)-methyltransferase